MYRAALSLTALALSGCLPLEDPAQNQAMTITISAPTPGTPVSRTTTVSVDASSAGGSIVSVTFDLPGAGRVADTSAPFSTVWDTRAIADGAHTIRATALDDRGAMSEASASITVANGACVSGTFAASSTPRPIPDPGGIISDILVSGNGTVAALRISYSATHPYPSELLISLISPSGGVFHVSSPENPVLRLDNYPIVAATGERASGTWRLDVYDLVPADPGTLDAWSLTIAGNCGPTAR